ncbi:metallophosphoesterase family protein [Devosia sp.]|uniref:metallophosphoesterase family protein n=1 Tax=Devosia sp. TaxID=1871048 RepID=UPI003F6F0742
MRIAVLSDVHGNLEALDAVLDDVAGQGVEATVALGDFLSGPSDPVGVADRLIELGLPSVRGNHDRYITDGREKDWHIDALVRGLLDERQHRWLGSVPATLLLEGDVFLCHGTPRDDNTSFMDTMVGTIPTMHPRDYIEAEAAGFDHEVLLCGHTHVPRSLRLADGRLVVNPGSVGLPMEIGSPDARYAIIDKRRAGWNTELRAVAYDHAAAAKQALDKGYPVWAEALTWGWASPKRL